MALKNGLKKGKQTYMRLRNGNQELVDHIVALRKENGLENSTTNAVINNIITEWARANKLKIENEGKIVYDWRLHMHTLI